MPISPSSPVVGAPVSGLTSPTYTVTADQPPNTYSKQYYVSAIGGTQTGVDTASSAGKPWTFTFSRPPVIKTLNAVDTTGVIRQVGFNTYSMLMRRGAIPLAGQSVRVQNWRSEMPVLVGADSADTANVKAACSSFFGMGYDQASNLAVAMLTGSL